MPDKDRYTMAQKIAGNVGAMALTYFEKWHTLTIDHKGHQDFVSEADRDVELAVRAQLGKAFPDDAVIGEEGTSTKGTSGYTWVIDPIDGTTNFINGIPQWCVILACVKDGEVVIGIIHDPCRNEMFHAAKGSGAFCNSAPIRVTDKASLHDGSLGIGFSGRTEIAGIKRLVAQACDAGTVFWRNGSGGLSLAYVASGRILGYVEEHMNAWDFLAGYLLVQEAGGRMEPVDITRSLTEGGRVIAAGAAIYNMVHDLALAAYD